VNGSRTRAACAAAVLGLSAWTFDSSAAEAAGAWSIQVTPYVWALGVEGRVRPGAGLPTVDVDVSFGELLEDVDFAAFGTVLARRDELVLVADASTSNASRRGTVPAGVPAEGGFRQSSVTLLGGWTLVEDTRRSFALLAGARAWSIRTRADVPLVGWRASPSLDFVDPLLAARFEWRFSDGVSGTAYVDVGGLGVGSESTWQLVVVANYRLNERLQLSGGYRHLQVDYSRRGVLADVSVSGPVVGLGVRF
jgi:hypothetical protein